MAVPHDKLGQYYGVVDDLVAFRQPVGFPGNNFKIAVWDATLWSEKVPKGWTTVVARYHDDLRNSHKHFLPLDHATAVRAPDALPSPLVDIHEFAEPTVFARAVLTPEEVAAVLRYACSGVAYFPGTETDWFARLKQNLMLDDSAGIKAIITCDGRALQARAFAPSWPLVGTYGV